MARLLASILVALCAIMAVTAVTWVEEMENNGAFEGDMVLDPDEYEHGWNVSKEHPEAKKMTYASIIGGRWPNPIPYTISSSVSGAKGVIKKAIDDYEKFTCLRFTPRTNQQAYLQFTTGSGCSSPVGHRSGRVNHITLAQGCWWKGIVMHEIGHSLGLYHEQSRPDRDQHVEIQWDNIKPETKFNFNKQPSSNINSLGTGYDYASMMHYGKTAFTRNGKLTIKTKNPNNQHLIGQRNGFSEIDKKQINLMYCQGSSGGGGGGGGGGNHGGSSCTDKNTKCVSWASKYCNDNGYKDYMSKNCRKSCGYCGQSSGSCADKNGKCASWSSGGFCNHASYVQWMSANCPKSCGKC